MMQDAGCGLHVAGCGMANAVHSVTCIRHLPFGFAA